MSQHRSHVWRRSVLGAMAVLGVIAFAAIPARAGSAGTGRASVSSGEHQGNGNSAVARISSGGRYVTFESGASNLVKGDTNGVSDIFLRDRATGKTYRVSVTNSGGQANGPSHSARSVTPDGRFVTFESFASNLVAGDTNGTYDVFVRDRVLHRTFRASVSSSGSQGNLASADPVISANGRFVAFESFASNLVRGDSNGTHDVFVRDRATGKTSRSSLSSAERQGNGSSSDPFITPDGRYVSFESLATNLVSGDTNHETDIFLRDRATGKTSLISRNSRGQEGNAGSHTARMTPNARYVAFESFSSNLGGTDTNHAADVFVRDRATGKTSRVSVSSTEHQGNGFSSDPSISANGNKIAFESAATNFTSGDGNNRVDVFVRVRSVGRTFLVSQTPGGSPGNAAASDPTITADGSFVSFEAEASNLIRNDTNGHTDVFVRGPLP